MEILKHDLRKYALAVKINFILKISVDLKVRVMGCVGRVKIAHHLLQKYDTSLKKRPQKMAKQPEALFRKKAMKDLAKIQGAWFTRIEQQSLNGTPDALGCIYSHFIALEFKASIKSKVTPLQEFTLDQIRKAGGTGVVCFPENWPAVLKELQELAFELARINGEERNDPNNVTLN